MAIGSMWVAGRERAAQRRRSGGNPTRVVSKWQLGARTTAWRRSLLLGGPRPAMNRWAVLLSWAGPVTKLFKLFKVALI
jgi:hypothetical protein